MDMWLPLLSEYAIPLCILCSMRVRVSHYQVDAGHAHHTHLRDDALHLEATGQVLLEGRLVQGPLGNDAVPAAGVAGRCRLHTQRD